jgi:K+/H+ antiporter YhaU regulatory subunit KhtT
MALKENNFSPRILYPEILSFKIDKAIKIFHSKQKLKQYMTTKPPQQEILQGNRHTEDESKENHEWTGSIKMQEKKTSNQRVAVTWLPTIKSLNHKTTKSPHTYQY